MKSQKNMYSLHDLPDLIDIPPHESWTLLDENNNTHHTTIVLSEWAQLYLFSARTQGNLKLHIIHRGAQSHSKICCWFHTSFDRKIECIVKSTFESSDATSEIHILSLAGSSGEILLDSAIDIQEWVTHIIGRLKERHIFLGDTGKIRWIPALIVHSDDIEASHALSIDRISDEELFYIRSRGFNRNDAVSVILDWAISDIFDGLKRLDEMQYEKYRNNLIWMVV